MWGKVWTVVKFITPFLQRYLLNRELKREAKTVDALMHVVQVIKNDPKGYETKEVIIEKIKDVADLYGVDDYIAEKKAKMKDKVFKKLGI